MYVYCVYPTIANSLKQMTSVVLIVFTVSSITFAVLLLTLPTVAQHQSATIKTTSWPMTV